MSDFDDSVKLRRLFRELAKTASGPRSQAIEDRLRFACSARRRRRRSTINALIAVAACLTLAAFGWGWRESNRPAAPAMPDYSGFMALPYAQTDIPLEEMVVVRVRLRPTDLSALGLPPAQVRSNGPVRADVLMGQDGIARAVRIAQ